MQGSYTQAGLALSWELDLWGRLRRLTESARAQYLATEEGRRGVIVSLIGDVMNDYFLLRERDLELEIARQTRDIAQDNLKLVHLRHSRAPPPAWTSTRRNNFSTPRRAQIASAQRDIEQTENASEPAGRAGPRAKSRAEKLWTTSDCPREIPPGMPSSLLERRPDIREAEQSLIAANAQIGAAKALYFPQITLTGFLGGQSRALRICLTDPSASRRIVPAAVLPLFNAGQIRAGVHYSEAQKREMVIAYQKVYIHRIARSLRRAGAVHRYARAAGPAGTAGKGPERNHPFLNAAL